MKGKKFLITVLKYTEKKSFTLNANSINHFISFTMKEKFMVEQATFKIKN